MAHQSECGEPTPERGRCRKRLAPGYNPLGFCADHLAAYAGKCGAEPGAWPVYVADFGHGPWVVDVDA